MPSTPRADLNRRDFLRASATTVGAGWLALASARVWGADIGLAPQPPHPFQQEDVNMTIRDYLSQEARRITEGALSDCTSATAWRRRASERRRQFLDMMGLANLPPPAQRPPLHATVTGVVERPQYRIEKLFYESLPKLYVTANLYVPHNLRGRAPAVLYVCGHAQNQKVHYQAHARRFAELGFVCLLVESIELGEVHGQHHGCYSEGWFHWYSRGYTPAGVELLNGIRGLDLLAQRPEVDATRLGVTGISGGGASTWWIAAGDERIKAAAPVCGTATLGSHIYDRTVDGHCDCMWWTNTYRWDLADVGGLVAPRPLLIASANQDGIFTISSIRQVYQQLRGLYAKLDTREKLRLVETPGGHSYHERSRTAIFSWFLKHLAGKDIPPEKVGDLDESPAKQESLETLRVYGNGAPDGNRTLTIQDDLIPLATPPLIADKTALERTRRDVIAALREKTFGAFPQKPPPLDAAAEYEFDGGSGYRFAFTSEKGWRLHGELRLTSSAKRPAPAVVALASPNEERGAANGFVSKIPRAWAKVIVEPRGTGDTAWDEQLNWHLRRATAWTGRTLASMRVWDTLRALQAVRTLPDADAKQIALAARGEMGAVALYAALLDGGVRTLILENPPATQNAPSEKNGRGPAIEMLHCLRITDLAQVAGLRFPAEIIVVGDGLPAYDWAKELYAKLGAAEKFRRVSELSKV